ncbi:MAG TPA: YceI family protein [Acidimicrobiia bacterium]|nr:YceI family protein [Acidimicrobiia bacterium]
MKRWLIGIVVVALVVVVGGPFVYFHFIQSDPPPKLSINTATVPSTAPGTTRAPLAGTWKIGTGSVVRYRVTETLFGQSGTAVGQTNRVTGSMTITATRVTTAHFTVDMTSITSDKSQRDGQFQGRIMDTASFPTATFTLTKPIELGPVPKDGVPHSYSATGKLQLHGTTRDVVLTLNTSRTGNTIEVQGNPTITFSDYQINNPSGGPASVGNSGELEFLLELQPGI